MSIGHALGRFHGQCLDTRIASVLAVVLPFRGSRSSIRNPLLSLVSSRCCFSRSPTCQDTNYTNDTKLLVDNSSNSLNS